MDTLRKFPLAWLLVCSLLATAGCAYNKPKPAVTKPQTTTPPTASVKPAPAPKPTPKVEPKPTPTKHTIVSKTETKKPVPKPKPHKPAKPAPQKITATPAPSPKSVSSPKATPSPQQAPAQQPTVVPAPQPVETLHIALDKLPITIHDQWVVNLKHGQCLLTSTPVKMEDGQGGTPVTFQLTPDSLEFITKSDIDTSYKGTGIQIDDGRIFALESVKGTNVVLNKQRKALLSNMQNGHSLQLTLGFWPTWPVTHTYSVTLPLANFGTAMHAWETCNQLLKSK